MGKWWGIRRSIAAFFLIGTLGGSTSAVGATVAGGPDPATALAPRVLSGGTSNWAGYIAEGTAGEFTTASADWVVPSVTCLSDADLYAPWVGIDGNSDETVEQTGVETTCATGSPVSQAWYEMYPAAPVFLKIKKDPVLTGDAMSGSVSYSTSTKKFTITIEDVTMGWSKTVKKTLKSAKRLSAEAVIEAPGSVRDYPSIPAVNFTDVLFNGQDLSTFSPVTSESGNPVVYAPGPITSGTNFTIAPTG